MCRIYHFISQIVNNGRNFILFFYRILICAFGKINIYLFIYFIYQIKLGWKKPSQCKPDDGVGAQFWQLSSNFLMRRVSAGRWKCSIVHTAAEKSSPLENSCDGDLRWQLVRHLSCLSGEFIKNTTIFLSFNRQC